MPDHQLVIVGFEKRVRSYERDRETLQINFSWLKFWLEADGSHCFLRSLQVAESSGIGAHSTLMPTALADLILTNQFFILLLIISYCLTGEGGKKRRLSAATAKRRRIKDQTRSLFKGNKYPPERLSNWSDRYISPISREMRLQKINEKRKIEKKSLSSYSSI